MSTRDRYLLVRNFDFLQSEWQSYAGFDGEILRDEATRGALFPPAPRKDERFLLLARGDLAVPAEFNLLGYDAGWYESADNHYSLILHHQLRFSGRSDALNEHLLFAHRDGAARLVHDWLAWTPDDPGDKETIVDETVTTFAIFSTTGPTP